jgi:hypothetical protein
MRHQAKTEPFGLRQLVWESDSIIDNGESKFAIIPGEANVDPLRGSMPNSVCNRLLRDSIQLSRHRRVAHRHAVGAVNDARDLEPFGGMFRQAVQRNHQPFRL